MVDAIPFTRGKKNISRDFADGVMMAELIHHYAPKMVELHNYSQTSSKSKKIENWNTLNEKVLKRLGLALNKQHIKDIVEAVPQAIEVYLYRVLLKFEHPEEENTVSHNLKAEGVEGKHKNSEIN